MIDHAGGLDGVTPQIEDAQNDVGKQLNQIENAVATGVDAIIVKPVESDATVAMSEAAAAAGIALAYVNRRAVNMASLPAKQALPPRMTWNRARFGRKRFAVSRGARSKPKPRPW